MVVVEEEWCSCHYLQHLYVCADSPIIMMSCNYSVVCVDHYPTCSHGNCVLA